MDTNSNSTNDSSPNRRNAVYKLRKKHYQKKFVTNLAFVGYLVIFYQYTKYGCSIWPLIARMILQSILVAPYPSSGQLQRIASSNMVSRITNINASTTANATNNSEISMPGGFVPSEQIRSANNNISEISVDSEVENLKKKARRLLFHGSFTLNAFYLLLDAITVRDFRYGLDGNSSLENGLQNSRSPFINDRNHVQGEFKSAFFLQVIGEPVPLSNIKANVGLLMIDLVILALQYSLFISTCVNFAKFDSEPADVETEAMNAPNSDGYDGNVRVTIINPVSAAYKIIKSPSSSTAENIV